MSNLRSNDFNESVPIGPEEILRGNGGLGEQHVLIDNGGFSSFHHFEEKDVGGNQAKLIGGALVVALLLGAAGIYAYTGSGSNRVQKAPPSSTASSMSVPSPIQTTPMTGPAAAPQDAVSATPAKSPYDAAPAATGETASAPPSSMTGTDALSAPADNSASQPDQNAAQTSLPTPPSPPDSSMASKGQAAVTPDAGSPAQDIPASATPDQQPATAQPVEAVQAPAKLQ